MPDDSNNIIIVSNRLPVTIEKNEENKKIYKMSSGGLVTGLGAVHNNLNSMWLGFLEVPLDSSEAKSLREDQRLIAIDIPKNSYDRYYNGYSNGIIWPLFHNFLGTMDFSEEYFDSYREVNKLFAEKILENCQDDSMIWIHDYQLMLVPQILKDHNPNLKISYFHHIPFPSSEIFRVIPARKMILRGLLGSDYIGFHTNDYLRHFLHAIQRLLGAETRANEIYYRSRSVKVMAHPLGIDFKKFADSKIELDHIPLARDIPYSNKNQISILGVDRLDYTKGLLERLRSFHLLLKSFPQYVGKVQFTQICVPSRQKIGSYNEIKDEVERLVGQINGEFGKPGYTPIQYLYRSIPFQEMIKLFRTSDILMVTPLRDGLNLVCKEYIASRTDEDGILILSEFAGAASEMGEALIVNPYDIRKVTRSLRQAIEMDSKERKNRLKTLRERISINTNLKWSEQFIESWKNHYNDFQMDSKNLNLNRMEDVSDQILQKNRIFLFLDYDGTLTPIVNRPEMAIPSQQVMSLLYELSNNDKFSLSIVTGRPTEFCDLYFKDLAINIVAEHGSFIKERSSSSWNKPLSTIEDNTDGIFTEVKNLVETYCQSVKKSHMEIKKTCVVWHYRECEPLFSMDKAQELYLNLEQLLYKSPLTVYRGKKSLEVRLSQANKAYGVECVLAHEKWQKSVDALVTVGDDTTDEDMHRVYGKENFSIHIGKNSLLSKYLLKSPVELYQFLNLLIYKNKLQSCS